MGVQKYKYVFFVFTMLFSVSLFGCKAEQTVIEEMPPMEEQAVEKFTITETESGKVKMILESESAIINEKKKIAYLKLPRVKFYQDGQYSSTLVSESAEINLETYDIAGQGKCTVDTVSNEYLQTTDLQYNAKAGKVYGNNDVLMKRENETVYGKSFEADTKLEKIVIKNQKVVLSKAGI